MRTATETFRSSRKYDLRPSPPPPNSPFKFEFRAEVSGGLETSSERDGSGVWAFEKEDRNGGGGAGELVGRLSGGGGVGRVLILV
jgi:hypothetical protein